MLSFVKFGAKGETSLLTYHALSCSLVPLFFFLYHCTYGCMFCMLLFHFVNHVLLLLS